MKDFIRRYQIVLHLLFLIALSFGAYIFFRALDPRIGVEGFGDLYGYVLNAVGLALVIFTATWFKNNKWHDIPRAQEAKLFDLITAGNWPAFWSRVQDRVEWIFLLVFFYIVIFGHG